MSDKLQEIKQRWQDAPKGPWKWVADRWLMPANYSDAGDYILLKTKTELGSSHYSDLITNSPTDVKWLIEQLEQAQAANKCPDCGGSGYVELCHDPLYTERCICTYDPASLIIEISELRKELEQAQAANQKLVDCLEWYARDERALLDRQTLSEVKGNG